MVGRLITAAYQIYKLEDSGFTGYEFLPFAKYFSQDR